jgi:hypothetical protein
VVDVSVLVSDALEFEATGAEKTDRESRIPDKTVYSLGARDKGQSIAFSMSGLDVSNPIYRRVGIGGAVVMVVAVIIGMVMTPRQSARVRLMRRRDELLALLEQLADDSRNAPSRAKIIAALDRIFHQLRALERLEGPPPPAKSATKEA